MTPWPKKKRNCVDAINADVDAINADTLDYARYRRDLMRLDLNAWNVDKVHREFQTLGPEKQREHLPNFSHLIYGTERRTIKADWSAWLRWYIISSSSRYAGAKAYDNNNSTVWRSCNYCKFLMVASQAHGGGCSMVHFSPMRDNKSGIILSPFKVCLVGH